MILLALALLFGELSLLAIGGASSALPAMERALVLKHHWMNAGEFARLFGLAQAAPGPNVLAVTLFGWRIAGLAGAAVATLAFLLPACCLAYAVGGAWTRFADRGWRRVVQAGLLPVTSGLMLAAGFLLVRDAATDWRAAGLAVGVATGTLTTRLHPLWFLAAAAGAGLLGFG
jgi:chromate transporter